MHDIFDLLRHGEAPAHRQRISPALEDGVPFRELGKEATAQGPSVGHNLARTKVFPVSSTPRAAYNPSTGLTSLSANTRSV